MVKTIFLYPVVCCLYSCFNTKLLIWHFQAMASEDEDGDNDVTVKGTETSSSQLADLEIQKIVHSAATDMATAQSKVRMFVPIHIIGQNNKTDRFLAVFLLTK